MIRKSPRHNLENPPGQIVNPVPGVASPVNQEKTLEKEIDEYMRGYLDGYKAGKKNAFFIPDIGSEASR